MLGDHAIVIGAGIAGMTSAKALSRHFAKVTILERDNLSGGPEARPGTPHCRQAHILLKAGLDGLVEFFPEFATELERAGAVRTQVAFDILVEAPGLDPWPQRDFGYHTLCMTRPLVESVVRRLIQQEHNISVLTQSRVSSLELRSDTKTVCGVRYDRPDGSSDILKGDLIIDASSRGAPTLALLDELGIARPEETEIGIDVSYATALFEIPPGVARSWRGVIHRPTREQGRGAFLFPIENNCWQVSLNGMHRDMPPDDLDEFIAFAKTLRTPTVYEAIQNATPIGAIHRFAFPSSVRRRFETMTTFPERIIPIGDVICRFNPALGQGMTIAIKEALSLSQLLEDRAGGSSALDSLGPSFFASLSNILTAPWSAAEGDFLYPKTRGERPLNFEQRLQFGGQLQQLLAKDESVHRLLLEINQLLTSPAALREPEFLAKVAALDAVSI